MTTATSAVPALLDALQSALSERDGLTGVTILSGPGSADDLELEYIMLGLSNPQLNSTQRYKGMGNAYKEESIRFTNELRANYPGKGETAIRAVRDRAYAMLAEVEDCLRVTYTLGLAKVDVAELTDHDTQQGADDKGRVCLISFAITARISLIS